MPKSNKGKATSAKKATAAKAAPKATAKVAAKTSKAKKSEATTDALGAVIPPKDTTLKSTFPRTTGSGHPVNERGKAIARSGEIPETQVGTPEKAAEGKVEPDAAAINQEIRDRAAALNEGRGSIVTKD